MTRNAHHFYLAYLGKAEDRRCSINLLANRIRRAWFCCRTSFGRQTGWRADWSDSIGAPSNLWRGGRWLRIASIESDPNRSVPTKCWRSQFVCKQSVQTGRPSICTGKKFANFFTNKQAPKPYGGSKLNEWLRSMFDETFNETSVEICKKVVKITKFYSTQILTGHGSFANYCSKFKLSQNESCPYCQRSDSTRHTLFECESNQRFLQNLNNIGINPDHLRDTIGNICSFKLTQSEQPDSGKSW